MIQGHRIVLWMAGLIGIAVGLDLVVVAAIEAGKAAAQTPSPGAGAAATDGVVRVREIEIIDAAGNVLMRVGADENGDGAIVTMSRDGTPLTFMGRQGGAGLIATFDAQGRATAVIGESRDPE